jgi:predicted phage baseplate assembly protein
MLNPLPNLDDRRWADLVEEGRALIPLYAREWTDHNLHDPGVTILEWLASVAEMDIFELNRVPDRHKRKFLALAGVTLQPPIPARAVLRFQLVNGAGSLEIPAGTVVATADSEGVPVPFRVIEPLTAVSGEIASVLVQEGRATTDYSQRFAHGEPIPLFGTAEASGSAFYLGLTEALSAGGWTAFRFHFAGTRPAKAERCRILDEVRAQAGACAPRPNPCAPSSGSPPTPAALPAHQSARVAWEYLDASGAWTAAATQDDTRSLTLDGTVALKPGGAMSAGGVPGGASDLYYVRARFAAGTYDAAPVAARIVLNGAEAEQTTAVPSTWQGKGNGKPDQAISLSHAPVVAGSVRVAIVDRGVTYECRPREDFDSSGRADRHYVLDAGAGLIRFGDGEHGFAPLDDSTIQVSFLVTRAAQGNLPEGRVFQLAAPLPNSEKLASVVNPVAAAGGRDAETLAAATGRALAGLRSPGRAITARDYEVLALETPGTDLARVAVVPDCHPAFDCLQAPGVITVIPVTHLPGRAPAPSRGTLALVARYLNRRRIIGTRVEIAPPQYLKISVRASVRALAGTSPALLAQRVSQALDNFLHPLVGGPEGNGWPTGRDVYRSEVMQWIDGVNGVDHVASLELQAGDCGPVCGNVCVPALWLVTAGTHEIRIV